MPRQSLNVDGKVVARKGKVRKRGCSSSSSSSLAQNYRLKRAFLVGRRGGSTTPVPMWKTMSSRSPSLESANAFKYLTAKDGEKGQERSVSARKLAAVLWEINGLPSSGVKMEILEHKTSEVGNVGKGRILESSELSSVEPEPVSEVGLPCFFLNLDRVQEIDLQIALRSFVFVFLVLKIYREWMNSAPAEEEHRVVVESFCKLIVTLEVLLLFIISWSR